MIFCINLERIYLPQIHLHCPLVSTWSSLSANLSEVNMCEPLLKGLEILSSCPSRIVIYDQRQGLGIPAAGHQVGHMPDVHLAHCHY